MAHAQDDAWGKKISTRILIQDCGREGDLAWLNPFPQRDLSQLPRDLVNLCVFKVGQYDHCELFLGVPHQLGGEAVDAAAMTPNQMSLHLADVLAKTVTKAVVSEHRHHRSGADYS